MPNPSNRVLFLAVPIGAGHITAAKAVKNALDNFDSNIETRFVNAFDWSYPAYGEAYQRYYEFSVRHNQRALSDIYESAFVKWTRRKLLAIGHRALLYRFPLLIEEYQPRVVVSTHFSPTHFALQMKEKFNFTLIVIITDYHIHPYWYAPGVDLYIVAHDDLIPSLEDFGVAREKVLPLGIPVDPRFDQPADQKTLKKKLGLPIDQNVVLLIGGKIFGGPWVELVKSLLKLDIYFIVLCGRNKKMQAEISKLKGRARLVTYGLVNNIHEYIRSCDYLITKAGGISTTEAMVSGTNLILANSLPGLEKYNDDFFVSRQAAVSINADNACEVMGRLLSDKNCRTLLKNNLAALAKHRSALNIAKKIKSLI